MYRLLSRGLIGAPCGVPRLSSRLRVLRRLFPCSSVSSTAASSHILIRCSIAPSTTRRATDLSSSVWNTIELATQICVNNFSIPSVDQLVDLAHRVQCAPITPIGILFRRQIRFENRFEYQDCRRFHHPVSNGGYP
jgi:hypothetical protein